VRIRSQIESDQLILEVSNSGNTRPAVEIHEGVGLSNTRSRLEQLYGDEQTFTLESGLKDAAFKATIRLPVRRDTGADQSKSN
jgi:LytS/YehU family sensor histidine kinase